MTDLNPFVVTTAPRWATATVLAIAASRAAHRTLPRLPLQHISR